MRDDKIKNFCKAYKNLEKNDTYFWKILDEALLFIFKRYPKHNNVEEVFSKVALINRVYRANLHFAGKKNIEAKVAEAFMKHKLDTILKPLNRMTSLTYENLQAIVRVHGQVVSIVKKITKKTNNSFVSKYMNFHFPNIVPIYDQYAYEESWRLIQVDKEEWQKYDDLINYDYGFHCESVFGLLKALRANGVEFPSLKLIDILLYEGMATQGTDRTMPL